MEIFFAFVLLIGAYSAGASLSDHDAVDAGRPELDRAVEVPDLPTSEVPCRYGSRGVVQRDLTVPWAARPVGDATAHETASRRESK